MKKVLLVLLLLHCSLFCVGAHVKNMKLIFYWYEGYAPYRLIFPYKVKQDYLTINPVQRLIGYKLQTDVSDILYFKPIPSKISIRNLDEGIASLTKKKAKFLISHEDIDKLDSLLLSERKFSDEKKKAILQEAYELSKLPSDSLVSLFRSHSTNTYIGTIELCVKYNQHKFLKVMPSLNFKGFPWLVITASESYQVDYDSILHFLALINLDKCLSLFSKEKLIEEVCVDILDGK